MEVNYADGSWHKILQYVYMTEEITPSVTGPGVKS